MKKTIFIAITQLVTFCCFANSKLINITDSTYHLAFYKMTPFRDNRDSVTFEFSFNKTGDTILAKCFITPLWFLVSTKTSDYITFRIAQTKFVYFNQENFKFDRSLKKDIYILKFKIPKQDFKSIFFNEIAKLSINFSPNPDVKQFFRQIYDEKKIKDFDTYASDNIKYAKRNLKVTISNPNINQLEKIRAWLD